MSSVLLTYSKLIKTNVATQAINLADSGIMGHRVQCPMSVDDLNRFFMWQRTSGESAPIGHFTPHEDISGASFSYILANTLSKYYTDIDGVTGGLNFGSAILDSNPDPTIRQYGKITANDIIMAYVIYKIYGSSSNPTMNVVFNLQDAYDMLPNSLLVSSIKESLQTEEALARAGAVNDMFQDLLSEDPTRFFDAAGKQIPGLFEVNSTNTATGSWNFVENDRIELNVQFTFANSVTVNSTTGDSENIDAKVVIPAGTSFKIRLQLLATNTPTAAAAIQEAYVAATAEELVRQAAANKEAAQKAADAFTLATQAASAAQTQAAAAQATYNAAVTRNAKQQKAVLAAEAAVQAVQTALAAAKVSGNQANIQQQNAAALAAQALLANQQAIADLAATDLQNAATALAKATATMNAAQSAAAAASATQAAANAAVANTSLALETATAAALASTIAAATAASDPLTKALEAEKAAVLDPQNLAIILAKANAATRSRKEALNTAIHTFANQTSQLNNYTSILYNMNSAIATGSNDSQLQLYKAMVVGASNILNTVTQTSEKAASTLAASYTAELTAIQHANLASSNAASLSATVAVANTNSANRSLTAATTAYVYASTMNSAAAAAAAEAQAILNNRVSNGAVMTEVQTRTQALLDANKVYAAATSTMNTALVKMKTATTAYQAASTIAVNAQINISSVAASNLFYLSHYKTSVSTSSAYQANILSNAKLNQIALEVNSSLIRLNAAKAAVATAQANVSIAQLAIDTALAGGAVVSEITVLKGAYSKANDSLTQALLIQTKAQTEYNTCTQNAANGQVQLLQSDAMAFYNASITQRQLANDNIIHYSTLLNYATQQPTAFPPIDGLSSVTIYATQLGVWQTYLANFQTLSDSLLTQFNTDRMRASTLMAANPSISSSLGSLSNYYVANSNSSHLVFQTNAITSLLASLSNVGLAPADLEADLAAYSSQTSAALGTTANAYNTYLAESLAAQSISLVSSVGQEILKAASDFQLAQISSATMNTKINFYNSTLAAVSMVQLEYDQATSVMAVTEQALANAILTNTPPAQLTLLQQKYANSAANKSGLANKLSGLSKTVSTINGTLYQGSSGPIIAAPLVSFKASNYSGSGAWIDETGNGFNAMLEGGQIAKNQKGNGIILDGSTSWTFPNIAVGPKWTVSIWYKDTGTSGIMPCIIGQTGNPNLRILYTNGTWMGATGAGMPLGTPFTIGQRNWVNIQITLDGANMITYINGVSIGSVPDTIPAVDGNTVYRIGGSYGDPPSYYGYATGEIGEVTIYNFPLTQAEITSTYTASESTYDEARIQYQVPSVPGLQLWLDASDPLGTGAAPAEGAHLTTWADKSGNGYNGTVPSNQYYPCDPFVTYSAANSSVSMSNGTIVNSSIPPGTFSNAFNMFMVCKMNSDYYGCIISRCSSVFNPNWPNPFLITISQYDTTVSITEINSSVGVTNSANGGSTNNIRYSPYTMLVNVGVNQIANSINFLSNANLVDSNTYYMYDAAATTYSAYMNPNDLGDIVSIGGRGDGYVIGNISVNEVMLFNTELTDLQRQEIEGYLGWKWGLQKNLPITHPYFLSYPTIAPPPGSGSGTVSSSLFTPRSITGLTTWYDAADPLATGSRPSNGTVISNWVDKSSNAYNMVAVGSPTYTTSLQNGLPGLTLSGNTDSQVTSYFELSIPSGTFLSDFNAFVVYNNTSSNTYNTVITRTTTGSWGGLLDIYNTGGFLSAGGIGLSSNIYNTSTSLLNINISQKDAASSSYTMNINGSPVTTIGQTTGFAPSDSGTLLTLGTRGDLVTSFNGNYYEVLVFNKALSTAQKKQVEGYLAWKWGIQDQLPTNHTYISAPPGSSSSNAFTDPTTIPGAQLWLDAKDPNGNGSSLTAGTAFTTWADKSANGYNGTVMNPGNTSYSTSPQAMSFSSGSMLRCSIPPQTFTNNFVAFIVYSSISYVSANTLITRTSTTQNPNLGNPLDIQNTQFVVGNNNAVSFYPPFTLYNPNLNMLQIDINQKTGTLNVVSNGTSTFSQQQSWTPSDIGDILTICGRGDNALYADANISEVIIYNKELSTAQRQKIEGYLAWKWGLQTNLPTNHTYLSTPPISSPPSPPPPSKSIYSVASVLRQAELAVAQKNEFIQQANNAYNNYSQLNDRLQAVNQSTNSVLDKMSVVMAKGANLATIKPLQTQLAAIQEDTVLMQLQSANLYNTFLTLSTLITPDASFISTVNSTSNATFTATISARLNESAQQLQTAQIEDSAATTALAQANATLTLISTQFSIKKQQGISAEQMAPLTSSFTAAALDSANKNILLNFANAALAQAQSNYNSIYSTYSVGSPSIYTAFANTSNNLTNSLSTLVAGQNKQISSLASATSNVLTVELTNAYMGVLNFSTLAQTNYTHYNDLLVKYNTQMAGGNTDQIASIYAEMTTTYNKYVADAQNEILYTAAYLSSMSMATIDPQSKAILATTALNQTKVLQGARANELYENLQEANAAQFKLNNEFVSIQSAYTIAQADLQTATANDSPQDVLNIKYSTLIGISNKLTDTQIKYNLSQSATQLAKSYVSMNPNAQSILDTATAKYLAQANLAQANVLVSQYNAAFANEKEAYDSLQIAKAALTSAQSTFNSVIAAGADLATIQAARDAQNTAAAGVTRAALIQNNAMNALNQALQNANLDQVAQSLIITARLTNENTTAGGAVNGAQVQLQNFSTILATALATLNVTKEANTVAVSTLTYSISPGAGMTEEETTDIQADVNMAAKKVETAQLEFDAAMNNFSAQARLVSSLTQTFSTTTGNLKINTDNNTLLYNGFVYNQTYDKYVLKKSFLPTPVIAGAPFNLYSVTVNPINMGVYNPSTSYSLGNLVYYPNSDGAQYMSAISPDPRGP